MTLSVIVPATDSPPHLPRCLRALQQSRREADEVIVVREPRAAGPAAARNRGAEQARGDAFVFVDADVAVHPDALGRLEGALAAGADAVFGAYDDRPSARGAASAFRNLLHHHVHAHSAGDAETFWAGLGAVRAERFAEAGGFDGDAYTRPSVEDIELGMRLRRAGAKIRLDPGIRGTHHKAWSPLTMARADLFDRALPWSRLLLERGRSGSALNLGWSHRLTALAAVIGAAGAMALRPRAALGAAAGIVLLHPRLYLLLWRRGGARLAVAGVGLHVVHGVCAAAGLALALAERASGRAGATARPEGGR